MLRNCPPPKSITSNLLMVDIPSAYMTKWTTVIFLSAYKFVDPGCHRNTVISTVSKIIVKIAKISAALTFNAWSLLPIYYLVDRLLMG